MKTVVEKSVSLLLSRATHSRPALLPDPPPLTITPYTHKERLILLEAGLNISCTIFKCSFYNLLFIILPYLLKRDIIIVVYYYFYVI